MVWVVSRYQSVPVLPELEQETPALANPEPSTLEMTSEDLSHASL
jgi:hypothetical protein